MRSSWRPSWYVIVLASTSASCSSRLAFLEEQGILARSASPGGRKDSYTPTDKGLDLIPIVLNIVLWSAQHDAKSYVRHSKEFLARLRRKPVKVSEEVKALVRSGGCIFPEAGA